MKSSRNSLHKNSRYFWPAIFFCFWQYIHFFGLPSPKIGPSSGKWQAAISSPELSDDITAVVLLFAKYKCNMQHCSFGYSSEFFFLFFMFAIGSQRSSSTFVRLNQIWGDMPYSPPVPMARFMVLPVADIIVWPSAEGYIYMVPVKCLTGRKFAQYIHGTVSFLQKNIFCLLKTSYVEIGLIACSFFDSCLPREHVQIVPFYSQVAQ